jgi:signal transduction histidine kinase
MSETNADHNLNFLRHEIGNILMTVRGYAELMLLREGLDPAMRRYPEQIILAIDRATRELEQICPLPKKNPYVTPASNRAGLD